MPAPEQPNVHVASARWLQRKLPTILGLFVVVLILAGGWRVWRTFRAWQMWEVTRYGHLQRLEQACEAYAADRHAFPPDFKSVVEAGYLRENSRYFACPYVDDRLTTLPRHWSQSDFTIDSTGPVPKIKLAPHVKIEGLQPKDYEYFSIEIRSGSPLSPDMKKHLLEE
jgi:hypothetical protein